MSDALLEPPTEAEGMELVRSEAAGVGEAPDVELTRERMASGGAFRARVDRRTRLRLVGTGPDGLRRACLFKQK